MSNVGQGSLDGVVGTAQIRGTRDYQEDDLCVVTFGPPAGDGGQGEVLFILADGMGGHAGGEEAVRVATRAIARDYGALAGAAAERLGSSVQTANGAIAAAIGRDASLGNMGCTLVVASLSGGELRFASVGDSPMWIWRRGEMLRLNDDHSMAPILDELVDRG